MISDSLSFEKLFIVFLCLFIVFIILNVFLLIKTLFQKKDVYEVLKILKIYNKKKKKNKNINIKFQLKNTKKVNQTKKKSNFFIHLRDKIKRQIKLILNIVFYLPIKIIDQYKKISQKIRYSLLFKKINSFLKFVNQGKWIIVNFLLIFIMTLIFNDLFITPLNVKNHNPEMNAQWLDQEKAFEIEFDRPVNPLLLGHDIHPHISGKWELQDCGIELFKRKLKFFPDQNVLPGTEIQIYISNISNYMQTKATWDKVIDFTSADIPKIISTYPKDKSKDFNVHEDVILTLDKPDGNFVAWDFDIKPTVEFEVARFIDPNLENEKRKQIKLKFGGKLVQGETYKLTINNIPQTYNINTGEIITKEEISVLGQTDEQHQKKREKGIQNITFTTVRAPSISKIEPSGEGVLVDKKIVIEFDDPMKKEELEANFSIEPKIDFDLNWDKNAKVLTAIPKKSLQKDTEYQVIIGAGVHNQKGGVIEKEFKHIFKTIGPVEVKSYIPGNNTTNRSVGSHIRIEFNQEVNHASAQSKFSINPAKGGTFTWQGNVMIYNPTGNLNFSTKYNIKISKGIKTVHGLDSIKDYSFGFTTESNVFSLNIPYTRQPYRYACNLTAVKMALAYKGVYRSVDSLYNQVAKDNTPCNSSTNSWGNPNAGFLGPINGGLNCSLNGVNISGYGVHWGPVANLIRANGRTAEVRSSWSTSALTNEVRAGNPVIIWAHNGYSGSGTNITWNGSPYSVKGMHSYVVRGYIGSVDNPTSIMFSDPNRGHWTVSTSYFNSLWATFNRTAIVVK